MTETDPLAARIDGLMDAEGIRSNRSLVRRILTTGVELGRDGTDRLDLKITAAAVEEMRSAFRLFAPWDGAPKVTVFGSARTKEHDPLYAQAEQVAASLAQQGWMVVTGAGPGIMQAAAEGAGPELSIGVSIRLPFEEKPNPIVAADPNHVSMKYFFTRKLMLMKESRGFVSLPGGFGTLDETFELLTLQQTGKAEPVPIVLLDRPGGTYWDGLRRYIDAELIPAGLIAEDDLERVLITDSVEAAVAEITGFWRNYDSLRWVGTTLVIRMKSRPTDAEILTLDERFRYLVASGSIHRTEPLPPEVADGDALHLPRIALTLDQFKVGDLFRLISAVNALASGPRL
ncbi:TIGR00730 family Rossman fold protein [Microbacterium candidum]|uniref:TIGR00730 family Rossman fold protein n=1 Tax=Microbacterium candidum TaxID=3041922 RepID=A0ABT7N345_9MICO|nr:TIGR00730 family Rossman fold protein [Microbacterium sp. ASV49]MDL9981125.1 TIGR00730 family Rossman fold protein [Microbacterium sp. ASV49]